MTCWGAASFATFIALAGALTSSCGGSAPKAAVGADGSSEVEPPVVDTGAPLDTQKPPDGSVDVGPPLSSCRFRCQADVDCCAYLGLGAGCPTVYPNRATCSQAFGVCEWHWNCEQQSDCVNAKGAAYACIFQAGSTMHGFCRKQCATAADCTGEATLYDQPGEACTDGRCFGNGTPAMDGGLVGISDPSPPGLCDSDLTCAAWLRNRPAALVITGPICQRSTGRCVECLTDADCAGNGEGTACSLSDGRCGCRNNASCPNNLVCGY